MLLQITSEARAIASVIYAMLVELTLEATDLRAYYAQHVRSMVKGPIYIPLIIIWTLNEHTT